MNNKHIEVEDNELAIKNSKGDIAIIPAKDRKKVQNMIDQGLHKIVDKYVNSLPKYSRFAEDGLLVENTSGGDDDGIKSFLKKAAEIKGIEYTDDDANTLIKSYDYDYGRLVKDLGKSTGISDDGLEDFKAGAYKTYNIIDLDADYRHELKLKDTPIDIDEPDGYKKYNYLKDQYDQTKYLMQQLESKKPKSIRQRESMTNISYEGVPVPVQIDTFPNEVDEKSYNTRKAELSERFDLLGNKLDEQGKINKKELGYVSEQSMMFRKQFDDIDKMYEQAMKEANESQRLQSISPTEMPIFLPEWEKGSKANKLRNQRTLLKQIYTALEAPVGSSAKSELNGLVQGLFNSTPIEDFITLGLNELGRNASILSSAKEYKKQLTYLESKTKDYGQRNDGTKKGIGWLGEIKLPNGQTATEYSVGVEFDGKQYEIPTLVPTLTEEEIRLMTTDIIPNGKKVPYSILKKATEFAIERLNEGQSPFKSIQEAAYDGMKPEDAALLKTYKTMQEITSNNQGNYGYKVGEGVQDMLPFIVEFSLTSGMGNTSKKVVTEAIDQLVKKNVRRYATRETSTAIARTIGTATKIAVQPLAMPSTYKMTVEKQLPSFDEGGNMVNGMDPTSAFFNSWVEMMAEVAGEDLADMMKVGFRNSITKQLAKSPSKAQEVLLKTMDFISSDAGIPSLQGMPFELIGEEITGALQALQYQDGSFFTSEQQLQLLGVIALAGGSTSLLSVPGRINAKVSFNNSEKQLDDNSDKRFTDAVKQIPKTYKDINDAFKAYNSMQRNFIGRLTEQQYKDGLDYIYKAFRLNQMSLTRSAEIQKSMNTFGDNSGNLSTGMYNGEVVYVKNPEDQYDANRPETYNNILYTRTENGEVKPIQAGKIGKITTQSKEDVEAITEQEMNLREQQYLAAEKAQKDAAKRKIEAGRQVTTKDGKRTVAKVNADGTVTAMDDKGQAFVYQMDEVEPVLSEKEKEEKAAEEESIKSGISPEATISQDQSEEITGGRTLRVVDFSNGQSKVFIDGKVTVVNTEEEKESLLQQIYSEEIKTLSLELRVKIAELNEARAAEIAALPTDKPIERGLKEKEINRRYDAMISEIEAVEKKPVQKTMDEMSPEERFESTKDIDPALAREIILDDIKELSEKADNLRNEATASKEQKIENIKRARELEKEAKRLTQHLADNEDYLRATQAIHIYNEFVQERENADAMKLSPWEEDFMGEKVNEKSFAEHSDRNNITRTFAQAWFTNGSNAGSRNGNLDVIAQELSAVHGIPITEEMLVDFMLKYRNKSARVTTDRQNELRAEYKELTGESINNHAEWIEKQGFHQPEVGTASEEGEDSFFRSTPIDEVPFKAGGQTLQEGDSQPEGQAQEKTGRREKISETMKTDGKEVTYHHISERASQDLRERLNALKALIDIAPELAIHVSIVNSSELPLAIRTEEYKKFTKDEIKRKLRLIYATMSQSDIDTIINTYYQELAGQELSETQKGMVAKSFLLDQFKAGNKEAVDAMQKASGLTGEEWSSIAFMTGIPAVFHGGMVYVVSDRITSVSEMKKNIIHEVAAHMGFRRLFVKKDGADIGGVHYNSFNSFMDAYRAMSENDKEAVEKEVLRESYQSYFDEQGNKLASEMEMEQALGQAFAQSATVGGKTYRNFDDLMVDFYNSMSKSNKLRIAKLYFIETWQDYFDEFGNEIKPISNSIKSYLADEYIAEKSEAEETLSFIQRIAQLIRKAFAFTGKQFSNADVINILNEHRRLLREGLIQPETGAVITEDDMRFTDNQETDDTRFKILGEIGAKRLDEAQEATTRIDNLNVAREMETSGKDAKVIRLATGWEKGADNKWRYEVHDIQLNTTFEDVVNNYLKGVNEVSLTDVVNDNELFTAYPKLKETKVIFNEKRPFNSKGGYANPQDNTIGITLASPEWQTSGLQQRGRYSPTFANSGDTLKSVLLHEIQHHIQQIEGFERGGNPETTLERAIDNGIRNLEERVGKENVSESDRERVKSEVQRKYRTSRTAYLSLAGEVEARNVQNRIDMTHEERFNTLLSNTEDISREDQIFLQDGLNADRFKVLGEKGAKRLDDAQESILRINNLSTAKEMKASDIDAKTIKLATGWELGADGKWKYETENIGLNITFENIINDTKNEYNLPEIISDEELFTAYPELRETTITFTDRGMFGNNQSSTVAERNHINIVTERTDSSEHLYGGRPGIKPIRAYSDASLKSLLSHEVQHLIQFLEGFERGGNPQNVFQRTIENRIEKLEKEKGEGNVTEQDILKIEKELIKKYKTSRRAYQALSGEVEARNVQSRIGMSDTERLNTLLSETEDVSREDQIVLIKGILGESPNDIRFKSQEVFYSPTERAVNSLKQDKGTVAQLKAMILASGAKEAELDWMGFSEAFPNINGKITKQDLQEWVAQNKVVIDEVQKSADTIRYELRDETGHDPIGEWVYLNEAQRYIEDNPGWTYREAYNADVTPDNTRYSEYVIPGGSNYKEILLLMPQKKLDMPYEKWLKERFYGEDRPEARELYSHQIDPNAPDFKTGHWDEPNILAHIRLNERVVNGENVLFVEEIQSDWAQKGKKEGFKDNNSETRINNLQDQLKNKYPNERMSDILLIEDDPIVNELTKLYDEKSYNKVPDMPFKQTDQWVNLSVRRVLRYAAENGFDRIAWTNGEMQAERYDLSKQVDEVETIKSGNEYSVFVYKDGNKSGLGEFTADKLPDVVGKEFAQKIVDSYPEGTGGRSNFKGIDLKIGGEGMKAFYDNIVPKAFNKIGKKFGAFAEPIELDSTNVYDIEKNIDDNGNEIWTVFNKQTEEAYGNFRDKKDAIKSLDEANKKTPSSKVLSIPVTESMGESVLNEGVPMFKAKTKKLALDNYDKLASNGTDLVFNKQSFIPGVHEQSDWKGKDGLRFKSIASDSQMKFDFDYNRNGEIPDETFVERIMTSSDNITFMGDKLTGPPKIKSSADVAFLFKNLESASTENIFAVAHMKNGDYKVYWVSHGSTTGSILDIPLVVKFAVDTEAESITFVHNHPSGNLTASDPDKRMALKLLDALKVHNIKVNDPVIIDTDSGKYSIISMFNESFDKESDPEETIEPIIYQFDRNKYYVPQSERTSIKSHQDVATFLSKTKRGTTPKLGILILDIRQTITKARIVDETIDFDELKKIISYDTASHGRTVILHSNKDIDRKKINTLKSALDVLDIQLLDVIIGKEGEDIKSAYTSWNDRGLLGENESTYGDKYDNDENIRFKTAEQSKIISDARTYQDVESFIDAYLDANFRDAHSAPSNSMTGLSLEQRMDEGDDFNLFEVAQGYSVQPDDYFDPMNGPRWYGYDDKEGMQSLWAIRSAMNSINSQIEEFGKVKKMPKIIAYRAVPKNIDVTKFVDRDWITFSKAYAVGHGEHRFGSGEYKIIKQSVSADKVWWDGNDINEWGYDTGETDTLGRSDLKRIWEEANANHDIRFKIEEARKQVDTNPSEAQKEAGNYAKGHIRINGFDISIENPKGSMRSGIDRDGKEWSQEMAADYGYIRGTVGKDKDHLDVFLGDNPESGKIYVIDQIDPGTKKFDESKIMMGYDNMAQARKAYLGSYEEGWQGLRDITSVTVDELKNWIDKGDTKKPFTDTGIRFKVESSDEKTRKMMQDFYALREASETASKKKRSVRESAKESELTADPDLIESHEYNQLANKTTIDNVRGYMETYGIDRTMIEYFDGTFKNDEVFQNAIGIELFRHMNNDGNFVDAFKILDKLEVDGTKAGQAVQFLSVLKRMTPEGQLKYIRGKINKINDDIREHNKKNVDQKKPIDISEEEWAEIAKQLNEVFSIINIQDLKDFIIRNSGVKGINKQRAIKLINTLDLELDWLRSRAVATILNKVYAKVPEGIGMKLSTYQAISHLLNPKTFLRNILSNQTMRLAERMSRRLAGSLDYFLHNAMTGERVIGKATTSQQNKEIKAAAKTKGKETTLDILIEVNKQLSQIDKYRDIATQWSIPSLEEARGKTNTFQSQFFGALEKGLTESLAVPDEISKEKVRRMYLAEYENRTGLKPDDDIQKEADELAKYMTFQDDSWLSTHLTMLKKLLNGIGIANFGMGDLLIKYTRVPGNIITRTFEYSPFGAAKAIIGIGRIAASKEKTREQQIKAIMSLSRGLTGTAIMTLGYVLVKAQLGAGDDDDNDEIKKLENEAGLSGEKLNISAIKRIATGEDSELQGGDILMNYDWIQPIGSLLKAGAMIARGDNFGQSSIDIAVGFSELPSFLIVNKMISEGMYSEADNIGEKAYDVITVPLVEGAGGFVPSPIRQIASITDKTARDTYYSGDDKLTQAGVKVAANIPGVRPMLPPRVRPTGDDKVFTTDNALLDILSTFGPAVFVKYEPFVDTEMLNEISKYKSDKGTSYIPLRYAPKTIIFEGERFKLTKEEQGFYMRTYGKELMFDYIPEAQSIMVSDIDEETADEYAKLLSGYNKSAQDAAKEAVIDNFQRFNQ